jgi:hypothetical protein
MRIDLAIVRGPASACDAAILSRASAVPAPDDFLYIQFATAAVARQRLAASAYCSSARRLTMSFEIRMAATTAPSEWLSSVVSPPM